MTEPKPNKYHNGKIYKIIPKDDQSNIEPEDCYIGSSVEKYLTNRLAGHRKDYKKYLNNKYNYVSSFKLFEKFGVDNVQIILIESVKAETKEQLIAREKYYIKNIICCNKVVPGRTKKEYRQDNKEKLKKNNKEYYEDNKDEINQKKKEKFQCECGGKCRRSDKARHFKTIQHQEHLNKLKDSN